MLTSRELAKRLKAAMDNHNPPIRSVDMAKQCGVTPQAVNDWRRTGRIAKRHLRTIMEMTGQPLEFFLEDERGETKSTRTAWQRIGASLAVALALLTTPYFTDQAQVAFSSKVVMAVSYVKSWLRRLFRRFTLSYQRN